MSVSPPEPFRILLNLALFAQQEENPFTRAPFNEEKVTQLFSNLTRSLDLLKQKPLRELRGRLTSLQVSYSEQLRTALHLLERFCDAISMHASLLVFCRNRTLLRIALVIHLRSTGLNFSLAKEEGFWGQSLPYEKLEKLPEWPDYISYFYSPVFNEPLLKSHLQLSRKIQSSLNERDRVRLTLMEMSTITTRQTSTAEMHRLLAQRNIFHPDTELVFSDNDQMGLEKKSLDELRDQRANTFHEFDKKTTALGETVREELSELWSTPKTEFDVGYHLKQLLVLLDSETEKEAPKESINIFSFYALLHKLEKFLPPPPEAIRKLQALPRLLAKQYPFIASSLEFGFEGRNNDELESLINKIHHSVDFLRTLRNETDSALFAPQHLRALIENIPKKIASTGEAEYAGTRETFAELLFISILSGMFDDYVQDMRLKEEQGNKPEPPRSFQAHCWTCHLLTHQKELLLRTQSLISSLLPNTSSPKLEKISPLPLPLIKSKSKKKLTTKKRRKGKAVKKTRATKVLLSRLPVPSLAPATLPKEIRKEEVPLPPSPSPERSAPPTVEEARRLAELAQVPLRIRRHPRTYARPEFVGDRRNEVLHYLPPQLTQMLLLKKDPFIEKYALHLAQDPHFAGNQSVSATALCHDREMGRVYVGELKIGMTPEGLVYHVYLNPYTNPLGGRETLEQSMIYYPPADLREVEEGFTPVGRCQMRYNKPLRTVDVLDIEKNCLYRLFARRRSG